MNLIIRVTGRCNFNCAFCSATSLNIAHPKNGVPEQIKEVIKSINPTSIMISGGEPLLVGPEYYYELLELTNCHISITTNLKEFYYDPDKWVELFRNPRIGITTSFNYGDTRRWDKDTVYTEEKFIEIFNLFKEKVGNNITLPFIAVIDESNEDTVLDTVRLAKRLNTFCRINNATQQGSCKTTYPRYKMFQKYIEIVDAGLGEYEVYCKNTRFSACPMNVQFLCKSSIRTCYVDKDNVLHYYDCCETEVEHLLDYKDDINKEIKPVRPCVEELVSPKCVLCPLYSICNGCSSQKDHYPAEHCSEMQKLKSRFIELGWVRDLL